MWSYEKLRIQTNPEAEKCGQSLLMKNKQKKKKKKKKKKKNGVQCEEQHLLRRGKTKEFTSFGVSTHFSLVLLGKVG